MRNAIFAIVLAASAIAGCARDEASPVPVQKPPPARTLRIGLIPEQNIFEQLERYQPIASYLVEAVGTKIELKILPRYGNIVDNFRQENLDGAFFGSFTYVLAHAKLGVSVLARPMYLDNTSTYYGMLFVRKDSAIRGLRDMTGKRFAFVDKATTAGYLLPLDYFHAGGVKDYRRHFGETYFTGTHEDVVYDVLNGRADAGAAKNTVFFRLAKGDPRILRDLVILAESPRVPENALAVGKNVDNDMSERLRSALLTMHEDPRGEEVLKRFGAARFIRTTEADYGPVYDYARHIGLDLANYDYFND